MQLDGGVSDVVPRAKTIHRPCSNINDALQRCDGRVRQTGEYSVAIVQSSQHQRCHDVDQADAESDAGVSAERSMSALPWPHGSACSAYCQSRRQDCALTPLAAERQCRRQQFCSTVTDCEVMIIAAPHKFGFGGIQLQSS